MRNQYNSTLRFLVLVGPLWYLLVLSYIFISRSAYPFELEFMEGGSLLHVMRLEQGLPLYVAPSLEYAPFIYPPFYYYVVFIITKLTGLEWFLPLRLTSILATAGTTLLISGIIHKQTHSLYWASLAAGAFLATFRAGGAWFDIARVDMLFVFLLLAAIFLFSSYEHFLANFLAGIALALAFYTKQTALAYGMVFVAGLWFFRGWRTALATGTPFLLFSLASLLFENHISEGWYWYYTFGLPGNHALHSPVWLVILAQGYSIFWPVLIFALIGSWGLYIIRKNLPSQTIILIACIAGLIALSGASSLKIGAYANHYVPVFAGIALLFGTGGYWLEKHIRSSPHRKRLWILYVFCLLQFAMIFYNVEEQIPTQEDRIAGEQLVKTIRQIDGDIFMPYSAYLPLMAGKPAYAHIMTFMEIEGRFGHVREAQWDNLKNQFEDYIQRRTFSAIISNHEFELLQAIDQGYIKTTIEYSSEHAFIPVTGAPTRPVYLWLAVP